jgi:ketosteroid isomerase-like protein
MSATENKQLMQDIFAALAEGNSRPLVDAMAADFCWTVTGTTKWSKTYAGKQAVLTELFGTLRSRIAGHIRGRSPTGSLPRTIVRSLKPTAKTPQFREAL